MKSVLSVLALSCGAALGAVTSANQNPRLPPANFDQRENMRDNLKNRLQQQRGPGGTMNRERLVEQMQQRDPDLVQRLKEAKAERDSAKYSVAAGLGLAEKAKEFLSNFPHNAKSLYAEDGKVTCTAQPLPCAGKYKGADELDLFLARYTEVLTAAPVLETDYRLMYMDAIRGNVGVEASLLLPTQTPPAATTLEEDSTYFEGTATMKEGDNVIKLLHRLEFNIANGKVMTHRIESVNPEKVFELTAAPAQKHLRNLHETFYTRPEEWKDMIADDFVLSAHVSPSTLLGGQTEWVGKKAVFELMQNLEGEGFLGLMHAEENTKNKKMMEMDNMDNKDDSTKDDKKMGDKGKDMLMGVNKLIKSETDEWCTHIMFADANTIQVEVEVEKYMRRNGKIVEDFIAYKTYTFDNEGMLQRMDITFNRNFHYDELFFPPTLADLTGEENNNEKDNEMNNMEEDDNKTEEELDNMMRENEGDNKNEEEEDMSEEEEGELKPYRDGDNKLNEEGKQKLKELLRQRETMSEDDKNKQNKEFGSKLKEKFGNWNEGKANP